MLLQQNPQGAKRTPLEDACWKQYKASRPANALPIEKGAPGSLKEHAERKPLWQPFPEPQSEPQCGIRSSLLGSMASGRSESTMENPLAGKKLKPQHPSQMHQEMVRGATPKRKSRTPPAVHLRPSRLAGGGKCGPNMLHAHDVSS